MEREGERAWRWTGGDAVLPLGPGHFGEDKGAVFAETKLTETGELLLCGPVVPQGRSNGPAARDGDDWVPPDGA